MASYNSSFTEADNVGMLHVLNEVAVKFLAKGYDVELPFGIVRPTAAGICAGIQDSFVLGHGNNDVVLGFFADAAAYKEVRAKLEYRQVNPDPSGEARLYRLNSKLADASESSVLEFPAGATVRLHGRNLSFDFSDERQGVFLENEGGVVRVAEFERAGSNIVDAVIRAEGFIPFITTQASGYEILRTNQDFHQKDGSVLEANPVYADFLFLDFQFFQ